MARLSENLAELMAKKGMNQVELAKKSGIKQPLISSYLRESPSAKLPSLPNLLRLARALSCTLEQLTGLESTAGIENAAHEIDPATLTPEEREMLEAFKALPPDDWRRQAVENILLKRESRDSEQEEPNNPE